LSQAQNPRTSDTVNAIFKTTSTNYQISDLTSNTLFREDTMARKGGIGPKEEFKQIPELSEEDRAISP